MAITDISFKLYHDSNLTSEFNGTLTLTHESDLSDNPQDTVLYFGSLTSNRLLQESSNPGVGNITLTPGDNTPVWVAATAYVVGDIVQPVAGNTFVYRCTDAGTSAGSEPTWPTSGYGTTVVDGGVIWELYSKHHPSTEVKLALTSGGLAAAVAGAALNVATSISSGTANAKSIYIRVTNTVQTLATNIGNPEIKISLNSVIETSV